MWLDTEINRLGKLYSKIGQPEIETVLNSDDLLVIKDLSSTELSTLRNYLFVPKVIKYSLTHFIRIQHNLEWKTIRFTRLLESDFNVGTWLKSIIKAIRWNDFCVIHVGFSFIATNKEEKIYLFCPKSLAAYSEKCIEKSDAIEFAERLEKMTQAEHLQNTFINTTDTGNPFEQSGYCPFRLVCSYIWITK